MSQLLARDIMQRDVVVVREDAPLPDCVRLLCQKHITGVPVIDATRSMVGIVSQTDLLRHEAVLLAALRKASEGAACAGWEEAAARRVRDIMSREVICGTEETPVDRLVEAMLSRNIHRVVITAGRGVVGIVTTVDLARLVARGGRGAWSAGERRRDYSNLYSNRHEKLLMRVEHIDRIKAIQRQHAAQALHEHRGSLTVSDVVNSSLDFVLEHVEEGLRFEEDSDLRDSIAEGVYRCFLTPSQPARLAALEAPPRSAGA